VANYEQLRRELLLAVHPDALFVSEDAVSVRMLYPENERLAHFSDDTRVVVSEPLADLPGLWRAVPPGTALVIGDDVHEQSFEPVAP
jgi:predicted glutamine amidotransferase